MSLKNKILILAMMSLSFIMSQASAADLKEVTVGWWKMKTYTAGQTLDYNFDQPTYVENILISAEGSSSFAFAELYVDGRLESRLGVPGHDPEYPVTIRRNISSLVIKFQGTIKILDARMYVDNSNWEKRTPPGRSSRSKFGPWTNLPETPGGLGDLALEMTQDIQQGTAYPALISEAQYITYIIPIRKAALNLSASGRGRDFLSGFTRERAITLIRTIKSANHFLENLAQYDQFLGSVNHLLLVKESLESQYEMWIPQNTQP